MQIAIAYIALIVIWSTTPLAMQWSTQDVGYLFALVSRTGIGAAIAILVCFMVRNKFPFDRKAVKTYAAAGCGGYLAMTCAYWGTQFVPSGWISVIFGISPIITSIIATLLLGEKSVSFVKTGALLLCLSGLWVMFQQGLAMGNDVFVGILAVALGAVFHSLGIVSVKQINADISPLASMTGTLVVLLTLVVLTWFIGDHQVPVNIPVKSAGSILYLGIIGSVIGFMLFFYVLKHLEATRASLITIITPGSALMLGNLLNDEPITPNIIMGTGMILSGLLLFQYGTYLKIPLFKLTGRFNKNKLKSIY